AAIIMSQIKNHKKGKHSCGGSCAHCNACSTESLPIADDGLHRTILEIDGMMCTMCESHVNDAIRNNFKVKSVKSSHKTGVCTVTSEEPLDTEKVTKVLKDMGYILKNTVVIS
ncbi:MAG: cation transporter, partial [Sphaerochaetaceae bacterium]|nr:cation transporter [Sphaerochaetaceae bacterium]